MSWLKFSTIVGWLIATVSISFNVWQAHKARRRKVTWKIGMETSRHARFLTIDIVNEGTPLHLVHVILECPGMDEPYRLHSQGDPPEPFAYASSCRYYVENPNPAIPLDIVLRPKPSDIVLIIKSRVLELERIPATKWLKTLKVWADADPSLPSPPQQVKPGYDGPSWATNYSGKW
jgi:hypothetical protein